MKWLDDPAFQRYLKKNPDTAVDYPTYQYMRKAILPYQIGMGICILASTVAIGISYFRPVPPTINTKVEMVDKSNYINLERRINSLFNTTIPQLRSECKGKRK